MILATSRKSGGRIGEELFEGKIVQPCRSGIYPKGLGISVLIPSQVLLSAGTAVLQLLPTVISEHTWNRVTYGGLWPMGA